MHNSVRDVILQLYLPDDGFNAYASGTPYQYNDSTYVKQLCTLYNIVELLAIESGRLNGTSRLPVYVANQIVPAYDPNTF